MGPSRGRTAAEYSNASYRQQHQVAVPCLSTSPGTSGVRTALCLHPSGRPGLRRSPCLPSKLALPTGGPTQPKRSLPMSAGAVSALLGRGRDPGQFPQHKLVAIQRSVGVNSLGRDKRSHGHPCHCA